MDLVLVRGSENDISVLAYCRAIIGPMAKPRRSRLRPAGAGTWSKLRSTKNSATESTRKVQTTFLLVVSPCFALGQRATDYCRGLTAEWVPLAVFYITPTTSLFPLTAEVEFCLAVGVGDHVCKVGTILKGGVAQDLTKTPLPAQSRLPDQWYDGRMHRSIFQRQTFTEIGRVRVVRLYVGSTREP